MEYILAKELSERWNISVRSIQQYCVEGKINGAVKMGNTWLIPSNAKRINSKMRESAYEPYISIWDNIGLYEGQADNIVSLVKLAQKRHIAECELAHLRGELGIAGRMEHTALLSGKHRICAMNLMAADALACGDISLFRSIYTDFCNLEKICRGDEQLHNLLLLSKNIMLSSAGVVKGINEIIPSSLPKLSRKSFYLQNSGFLYNKTKYENIVGSLETLLTYEEGESHTPTDIYLYLMCGLAYYAMNDFKKADRFVKKAYELAYTNGFIMPFARVMCFYGTMLEKFMRSRDEVFYAKTEKLCEKIWMGYIKIHSVITGKEKITTLSRMEYQIARLAALGYTNKEIANHFPCSVAFVKRYLGNAFDKLEVGKRSQLEKYFINGNEKFQENNFDI